MLRDSLNYYFTIFYIFYMGTFEDLIKNPFLFNTEIMYLDEYSLDISDTPQGKPCGFCLVY